MDKYIKITALEISEEMRSDPEFGMDVLASFAKDLNTNNFAELGAGSTFHLEAAPILRRLADSIEETLDIEENLEF